MKNKLLNISQTRMLDKVQFNIDILNKLKEKRYESIDLSGSIQNLIGQCNLIVEHIKKINDTTEFSIKLGYLKTILQIQNELDEYTNNINQAIMKNDSNLTYIYKYVDALKKIFNINGDIILINGNNFMSTPTFSSDYKDVKFFKEGPTYFVYIDQNLDLYGLPLICHEFGHLWIYENSELSKKLLKAIKTLIGNNGDKDLDSKIEELTCDMFSAYLFKSAAVYAYLINSFIDFDAYTSEHFEDSFRLYMISLKCDNVNIINNKFLLESRNNSHDFKTYSRYAEKMKETYDTFMDDLFHDKSYQFGRCIGKSMDEVIEGNIDLKNGLQSLKFKINKE